MAYALEIGVPMSPTMSQIKVLLQAIEDMKAKILEVWADDTIPYAIKTRKLDEMRAALRATEHYVISLMSEEVSFTDGNGNHGEQDGHDGHDGTDGSEGGT
jgi:hypothetical protein